MWDYWRVLSKTSEKETIFLKKDTRKHWSWRKRFLIFITLTLTFLHGKPYHGRKGFTK